MDEPLVWDASYAIAKALQAQHSYVSLEEVSLQMVYQRFLMMNDQFG
jgi:hypothetical protein